MAGGEDSNGNVYIFWTGMNKEQTVIYLQGQSISDQGELLWGPDGKTIITPCGFPMGVIIHNDTLYVHHGVDSPSKFSSCSKIHINQFNLDGQSISQPAVVNDVSSGKGNFCQSDFVNNQTVFAWRDGENRDVVKVQNYLTSGSIGASAIKNIQTVDYITNFIFDPVTKNLTIPGDHEILQLCVYNSLGVKVFEKQFSTECSLDSLPHGLYLITILNKKAQILISEKLIL
jgi:hypothetical protein